ncbi:hypothetical protein NVP1183O_16 [Vibrio phage 1.183.O._10N.286.48.B7]|nr:hypothetical protein NVP1183O_16 [Vibrio phage 1.183.O._10N.286.48.B7]
MAVSMIGPKFYAWDRNGKPLAFGKLYTYQARTNTPKPTYQSEDQVVENTNPVILNGEGYANVYLDGAYKMVLKDKDENEIWSSDPVTSASAEEWVNCLSAQYVNPLSFKVTGNETISFSQGRRVRLDSNSPEYGYATVLSSSYAGGETTVNIYEGSDLVTTGLSEVCTSIVSAQSIPVYGQPFSIFSSVGDLISPSMDRVTPNMIDAGDVMVKTTAYYGGWAVSKVPLGGAGYILSTIQRVRDTKQDQSWEPDGYSSHYLFGGTDYVAIIPGNKVTIEQCGAVADWSGSTSTSTDNAESFKSALNNFADVTNESTDNWYYCSETLNIKKSVYFHGLLVMGAGVDRPLRIKFADDAVGIIVHRGDTNASSKGVPVIETTTTAGDGTVLEAIQATQATSPIVGNESEDIGLHGIWTKARTTIRNCRFERFRGNGLHVVASGSSSDPYIRGNANSTEVINSVFWYSSGHGHYTDGADVNACHYQQLSCYHNNKHGSFDSSFLGNNYTMCNLGLNNKADNGYVDVKGDNLNARSVYTDTYLELSDVAYVELAGRSILVGGNIDRYRVTGAAYMYAVSGLLRMGNGLQCEQKTTSEIIVNSGVGGSVDTGEIQWWQSQNDGNVWRFQWDTANFTDMRLRYANLNTCYTITGKNTTIDFGTASPKPYQFHQPNIAFGTSDEGRRMFYLSILPTSGEFAKGDIIWTRSANAGGKAGWYCTTGGTAGSTAVFKTMAAIDA